MSNLVYTQHLSDPKMNHDNDYLANIDHGLMQYVTELVDLSELTPPPSIKPTTPKIALPSLQQLHQCNFFITEYMPQKIYNKAHVIKYFIYIQLVVTTENILLFCDKIKVKLIEQVNNRIYMATS